MKEGRPGGMHDGMPDRPIDGYEDSRTDQQDAYEAHLDELEGELPEFERERERIEEKNRTEEA